MKQPQKPTDPTAKSSQNGSSWNPVHMFFAIGVLAYLLFSIYSMVVLPIMKNGMLIYGLVLILTGVRLMSLFVLSAAAVGLVKRQRMGWIGMRAVAIFTLLSFASSQLARGMNVILGALPDGQGLMAGGFSPEVLIPLLFFAAALIIYNSAAARAEFPLKKDDGNIAIVLGVSLWIMEVMLMAASGYVTSWYINSFA